MPEPCETYQSWTPGSEPLSELPPSSVEVEMEDFQYLAKILEKQRCPHCKRKVSIANRGPSLASISCQRIPHQLTISFNPKTSQILEIFYETQLKRSESYIAISYSFNSAELRWNTFEVISEYKDIGGYAAFEDDVHTIPDFTASLQYVLNLHADLEYLFLFC
jgi:hypothetical protein